MTVFFASIPFVDSPGNQHIRPIDWSLFYNRYAVTLQDKKLFISVLMDKLGYDSAKRIILTEFEGDSARAILMILEEEKQTRAGVGSEAGQVD